MCLKGKLESQAPQLLKVHGFLFISSSFRWFSKCAMFHPNKEAKRLRLNTQFDLYVLFHHTSFSSVHREISSIFTLDAKHNIDVSVSKMKDLNTELTPCYDGPNYSEAEFEMLGKVLKEKFHCTSPFLPKIYRAGAQLCKNSTVGEKVQNFIRATGLFATNMWKNDYYFLPPCTYNTYSYDETNSWTGTKKTRYLSSDGEKTTDRGTFVRISLISKMDVTERFWSYGFVEWIAECGGFGGLFLGYSFSQIGDFIELVTGTFKKYMLK